MKRNDLLRHLVRHGCRLKREGHRHSIWRNPANGRTEAISRQTEIDNILARKICRSLSVPEIGRQ